MIGGHDHIVDVRDGPGPRLRVIRIVESYWPDCVTDLDQQADRLEIFFYPNREVWESWEADGRTDNNRDQMLHVIHELTRTTIVSDERLDSQTARIAREICEALQGYERKRLT